MSVEGIPLVESETTKLLRQTVRDVCASFGHAYFLEVSRAHGHPRELWSALGESGLLGVSIPEEYGGGGAGTAELVIVAEEVAASGSPLMLLALSPAVCATTLAAHGSAAQREKWLPGLVSGADVLAFAITEPDAGSNSHRLRTTATKTADGWSLSGSKTYISHVDNAKAILIVARVRAEDSVTGVDGLGLFLMDVDVSGLTVQEIDVEITSPERQFTLFLDDVRLPADSVVGEPGNGLTALFTGLNPERIASAALLNGIARYALGKGARYATERVVWDVPIGAHQAIATHWPGLTSFWRLPDSSRRVRQPCLTPISMPGRPQILLKSAPPTRQAPHSMPPSRPTVETGWQPSTAWQPCSAWCAYSGSRRSPPK